MMVVGAQIRRCLFQAPAFLSYDDGNIVEVLD
jgi:hypothetical protein